MEKDSGIQFFHELGFLSVGYQGNDYITNVRKVSKLLNSSYQELTQNEIYSKFPFLSFPEGKLLAILENRPTEIGTIGLYQSKMAGIINPRKLLEAQLTVAKKNGVGKKILGILFLS